MIIDQTPEPQTKRAPQKTIISKALFQRFDFAEGASFHRGPQRRSGLQLALWTWLSAGIDTLVLISMSCFFMVMFSFLMQTSAKNVLNIFIKQPEIKTLFTTIFLVSFWMYLITMRVLMSASVGEWTCQLRLGQPTQRLHVSYILRVMARTSLILMTGVVVLPLLSLLLKRDLVGGITGIKIYSLK
ncbi:MAG: hypothetical protein H7328_08370 [Bdellovibrio sp.]|nr:hypothetical protein [Bdellovibrio sp.]